ncbi:MAG TPA: serine hydrolase [Mucilaginibacter sp.]|jgi:CubicO group peptidase (beta-lactamase class C family)|nr:serine hydrolase [Mucilaginibacter sp.]
MANNRCPLSTFILAGFILINSACAQNPPLQGQAYVNEEKQVEKATVLLNNEEDILPFADLSDRKVASIHFTYQYATGFDSLLTKYTAVKTYAGTDYVTVKTLADLDYDTKLCNTLIVQLADSDLNNAQIIGFINDNLKVRSVVIALFGNAKSLLKLNGVNAPIVWCSRPSPVAAFFSVQAIFGGVAITQKLTSAYPPKYRKGYGFTTLKTRLQYTVPEDASVQTSALNDIDNIAYEAIRNQATPGCVVLVAKDGKVIYNKAFGYHTYDNVIPDKLTDIFDLASMTKVSATTMETMRVYEEGRLNLDSTVGDYLPMARHSDKAGLVIRDVLEHQSGLIPDIKTYEKLKPSDVSADSSVAYPHKIVDHYFLRKDYFKDVMWTDILNSPLKTRGQYVYSDLSMVVMKEVLERITTMPINDYVQQNFYGPLGMQTAGYLPLNRFPRNQIIPTEDDEVFRHTLLIGYVHDPTAAMLSGVSGNAGLFASANDIGILYQMLLNKGSYGGVQYFKPQTVDLFTAKQSAVSRRGLGFDRWDPIADRHYPSKYASDQTYGHTGYTGTCIWVDPKYNLVYVFLSNRVNPKVTNKLSDLQIRGRIQDVVYQAIDKGL